MKKCFCKACKVCKNLPKDCEIKRFERKIKYYKKRLDKLVRIC